MAVQKVKFNDTFIYVNDEVDENETGIVIKDEDEFDKTIVMNPIEEDDTLENTMVDIFGGKDNE